MNAYPTAIVTESVMIALNSTKNTNVVIRTATEKEKMHTLAMRNRIVRSLSIYIFYNSVFNIGAGGSTIF